MSDRVAVINASIERELLRIKDLSVALAVVLTNANRASFGLIIADIDAAMIAEPEHAARFAELRETVLVMRDFNPLQAANDNGG